MLNYISIPILWGFGILSSSFMFDGLSGKIGYCLIFSWWLTAYFSKMTNLKWSHLLIQLALIALILLGTFSIGKYEFIYHDAPTELSLTFGALIFLHAIIAISPGVFGKITNIIESFISGRMAGQKATVRN
jgi:hypothetical protein